MTEKSIQEVIKSGLALRALQDGCPAIAALVYASTELSSNNVLHGQEKTSFQKFGRHADRRL